MGPCAVKRMAKGSKAVLPYGEGSYHPIRGESRN